MNLQAEPPLHSFPYDAFQAQAIDAVNRVFFMRDSETMSWLGYNLDTGAQLWGPITGNRRAYSYFGSGLGAGPIGWPANGSLYTQGYGGEIVSYNGKTGSIQWVFNDTNSGDETAWGNYPIFIGAIADGKIYAFTNEHSPNYPLYKGESVYCLNASTGKLIWKILGMAGQSGGPGASTMVEADGFLSYYNYYDNQIYVIGKGPSALTVSAPNTAQSFGNTVLISGTVMDNSPGAKAAIKTGEFQVVPAVSDASQAAWMEYIYMQKPKPANATGVPVNIDVIDTNGNFRNIGTATSDSSGQFSFQWTPDIAGAYTVMASFPGSESYWPSTAQTQMVVLAQGQASPSPTTGAGQSLADIYFVPAIVVLIVLVVIFGVVTLAMLRRR